MIVMMKRLTSLILLCVWAVALLAQRLVANAPASVSVGDQFRLTYTVNTQSVSGFRVGTIPDAFEVLMGPSTSSQSSFQMVNGHTSSSSSITYTYILYANKKGTYTILADGGANIDCRPEQLGEFAVMGSVYMREMFNITSPTVGLLNNGAEPEKGNEQTRTAHRLLTGINGINFVGNIECRDLLTGAVDVIVADGFNGNIGIKASEGMGSVLFGLIKEGIMQGGLRAKLGYVLLKPVLKKVKNKMSSDDVGGAVFLGMKKVLVKTHGSGKARAFMNAVIKAHGMAKAGVPEKIEQGLKYR